MPSAKKQLVAIVALLLVLTGCSSTTKATFPDAPNDVSTLSWSACHGHFQCATLKVPIDYSNKSLGQFDIAVVRYRDPNQHDRIGSLVVNPGGPGVSGVQFALDAEYILNPDVLERYDIVGFDPRGIGDSTPISCLTAAEQDASFASDAKPDNDAEYAQALVDTQSFVDKCLAKTPNLAHFSTIDAARDMELLRQGLGDSKLNYLGFSYGTYLGTLFAQLFPQNVGRFVLDGAVDSRIGIEEQTRVQIVAFDQALANFIADCPKHKNCPLPTNITPQFFTNLFNDVSNQPLQVGDRKITEGLVVTGTAAALYDDVSGWPLLRTAISEALSGDGTTFAKLADAYNGRNSDGTYINNENDANIVIECLDWQQSKSNDQIRASSAAYTKAAPVFGPYVAFSGITCNLLSKAIGRTQLTTDQNTAQIKNTATPVLVIGTTQDPATPYVWAKGLSGYIAGSRLITLKGEGHTGYGRGSACTDDAVDKYLLTGKTPRKNLICTQ
jgi:pimeloyl-ACP methyl ester carboxylesterase